MGRDPPPKSSQIPPTSRRAPKAKAPPEAGAGLGSFGGDSLLFPAPISPQPVNSVLSPGPPARANVPLPVGPVADPLESKLQAVDLLSSYMDAPMVEALRARLSPPKPAQVTLALASHRALAQELADKCKRQEKLQTQLEQQRVKIAEVERTLERMQRDLVDLVGEVADLDEEILELRRKVSIALLRSLRRWKTAPGRPPGLSRVRRLKRRLCALRKLRF